MAYSQLSDIQAEMRGVAFSATTTPTATDIARWIDEADQYIDSRIGLRFVTPVSGSASLNILRSISIGMVVDRVRDAQAVKTGGSVDQGKGGSSRSWDPKKEFKERIQYIVDGLMLLPDATLKSQGRSVRSFTFDNQIAGRFDQGSDQW